MDLPGWSVSACSCWGIYGYVTARKDGEAEAMNGALGKLISGAVLIGMKGVLKMLGIVS